MDDNSLGAPRARLASLGFMLALLALSGVAHASQKTRDAKAQTLLESGVGNAKNGQPAQAKTDLKGCIAQRPSKDLLGSCYRNLGIVQVGMSDKKGAIASFKKYLPICKPEDCDKVKAMIDSLKQP